MLLWKRYVNNKMAAMRFLHLQQYSHRLNLLYYFYLNSAPTSTESALSSRSAPSVLVGVLFKKFGLYLNTPRITFGL